MVKDLEKQFAQKNEVLKKELEKQLTHRNDVKMCENNIGCQVRKLTQQSYQCYMLVKTKKSWSNAKSTWESRGGFLAEIYDKEEELFIHRLIQKSAVKTTVWFGARW